VPSVGGFQRCRFTDIPLLHFSVVLLSLRDYTVQQVGYCVRVLSSIRAAVPCGTRYRMVEGVQGSGASQNFEREFCRCGKSAHS